jgi:DNA replication protein DnaC
MKSTDACLAAIDAASRELKLPTIRANASRLAEVVERQQGSHLSYLGEVLSCELDARNERRRARRVVEARFARMKRLEDFDITAASGNVTPATLAVLRSGSFLEKGHPVVFIGDSGTGKSHLLIGTGLSAAESGKRVRYVTCAALVNELCEAAEERQLSRVVARYGRFDLLCLDELGYVRLDPRGAELLFQIITEREERSSIAVASNAPFSEWGRVFSDPRLVAAIVDRLTFNSVIVETGSDSYRLASTKAKRNGKTSDQ